MKSHRTLIQACLLSALLLLALPATVQAQFTFTTNDDNTITITGYNGTDRNVIIPSNINSLPVTDIGYAAFNYHTDIREVTIANSVKRIGAAAFIYCYNMTNVLIADSVTNIETGAFSGEEQERD